jgi:hypothetical protein
MNATVKTAGGPPRFIGALVSGFNLVTHKVYLLFLPIGLDLLLWFGPRLSLKTIFEISMRNLTSLVPADLGGAGWLAWLASLRATSEFGVTHFNLLSLLSAIPIGIPSLMTNILPIQNPLGATAVVEISSLSQFYSGFFLFALLGLVLGSIYFSAISRATASTAERFSLARVVWQTGQVLFLTLLLIFILFLLAIPIVIVSFILGLISQAAMDVFQILSSFLVIWILIPLIFSPHGIFVIGQNAFRSMLISLRLVRSLFPSVGLFLLSAVVIAQGLGLIWRMAPETSWLMLAGVFGNAFISTGLLAASFFYFRGAASWAVQSRKLA